VANIVFIPKPRTLIAAIINKPFIIKTEYTTLKQFGNVTITAPINI